MYLSLECLEARDCPSANPAPSVTVISDLGANLHGVYDTILTADQTAQAVATAAGEWHLSDLHTAATVHVVAAVIDGPPRPGLPDILAQTSGSIAEGSATITVDSGELAWTTDIYPSTAGTRRLTQVVAHELGHALGLDHNDNPATPSLMRTLYNDEAIQPTPADLDAVFGDNRYTQGIGAFDPATATWYLRSEQGPGAPDAGTFRYGGAGWLPVVGNWTGSGRTGIAVVDPATETWYIRDTATPGAPSVAPFRFGAPGWLPVAGDWNGDGTDTIGVFDPVARVYYLAEAGGVRVVTTPPVNAGFAPALDNAYLYPVVVDTNADGVDEAGFMNSRTGLWYLPNYPPEPGSAAPPTSAVPVEHPGDVVFAQAYAHGSLLHWLSGGLNGPQFDYGMAGWVPLAGVWE